jgi:hypothetical protein
MGVLQAALISMKSLWLMAYNRCMVGSEEKTIRYAIRHKLKET